MQHPGPFEICNSNTQWLLVRIIFPAAKLPLCVFQIKHLTVTLSSGSAMYACQGGMPIYEQLCLRLSLGLRTVMFHRSKEITVFPFSYGACSESSRDFEDPHSCSVRGELQDHQSAVETMQRIDAEAASAPGPNGAGPHQEEPTPSSSLRIAGTSVSVSCLPHMPFKLSQARSVNDLMLAFR